MTAAPAIEKTRPFAGCGLNRPCPVPGWRVAAASVRGTGHAKSGAPCGDACRYAVTPGGTLIAAVADGAGSAPYGEVASAMAADAAVMALCSSVIPTTQPLNVTGWEEVFTDALQAAAVAVAEAAAARQAPPADLATTLILVVTTPAVTVAVQIGDGAVVIEDRDGNLILLTAPPRGEYLNETHFLSEPEFVKLAQGALWDTPPRHVCMFTDGLQMLALRMREAAPHRGFFSPLFRFVAGTSDPADASSALAAFLESAVVSQRTGDDLTLLVAHLQHPE